MPTKHGKVKRKPAGEHNKSQDYRNSDDSPTLNAVYKGLSGEEVEFLTNRVSFTFNPPLSGKGSARKCYEASFISAAAEALGTFHMCVLHGSLSADDVANIEQEYSSLLDVKHGAHAIGEKDSSKRSGTRMW